METLLDKFNINLAAIRYLLWLLAAVFAAVLQSVAAGVFGAAFTPDFSLLLLLAAALLLGPAGGLCLAFVLGLGADMFSGALFGQHAVARLMLFAPARIAAQQLNLRRKLPFAAAAFLLVMADTALLFALGDAFALAAHWGWRETAALFARALLTALCAPPLLAAAVIMNDWFSEYPQRALHLDVQPRFF